MIGRQPSGKPVRHASAARHRFTSLPFPPYFMTFACCRSGNVHYEYGILVTEHSFVSSYTFTRVGMTASSIGYLFREVISINKELIYSHIYSVVSPIDGHLIMGLMGQRTTETTCPPNPCASERVNGVQAEFSVRMLMKPARAQRFALGPKLPWVQPWTTPCNCKSCDW